MTKEDISITYENNVFYCTKNGTKWISVDGEKWYGEEKRIKELELELTVEKDQHQEEINLHLHAEKYIKSLEKENAELKAQVNEWLNAYSDTSLVKVLRDCIYKNEKLSSQEQQELSAWVECAMDFGRNLDECAGQLTKAKEVIKDLLNLPFASNEEVFADVGSHLDKAEQFLRETDIDNAIQKADEGLDLDEI